MSKINWNIEKRNKVYKNDFLVIKVDDEYNEMF